MKIIFAGHFTIGENPNKTQLKTISEAKKLKGDLAILVNDLDLKRKLQFFKLGGKKMVLKHYGSRKKCGTTKPLCELPEYDNLPKIIDWNFYKKALAKIEKSSLPIDQALKEQIIPEQIQSRLKSYRVKSNSVKIFTERELRNRASLRLANREKNSKNSWLPQLEKLGILEEVRNSISKIPTCGGIQLALFEKASGLRYKNLTEIAAKDDRPAIKNGLKLKKLLNLHYPNDQRWQIETKFLYF